MRLGHAVTSLSTKFLVLSLLLCFHPVTEVLSGSGESHSGPGGPSGGGGSSSSDKSEEAKCPETVTRTYYTDCQSSPCDPLGCGDGTLVTSQVCEYLVDGQKFSGCQWECKNETLREGCCEGFWGPDCLACPGKDGHDSPPCNNNGECDDGVEGNGHCDCDSHFDGNSCELCKDPNMFGKYCDQECPDCGLNGHCDSKINGHGCLCLSGYTGSDCELMTPECEAAKCDEYAFCEPDSGQQFHCTCFPGYQMESDSCQVINPCDSGPCIAEAECVYIDSLNYQCACREGYQGDGKTCDPVDPCQTNSGDCPLSSSTCLYIGPGQSYCECLAGYEGFVEGEGCSLVDVCDGFTGECAPHAGCLTVAPFTPECRCLPGYAGNGTVCYGHIMEVLTELNGEVGGQLEGQLNSALYMLRRTHESFLSRGKSLTLIAATDEGYANFEDPELLTEALDDDDLASYLMQLHMLPTAIYIKEFVEMRSVYTFTGVVAEASSKPENPSVIKYKLKNGSAKGKFEYVDIPAFNGVIHIIDQLLYVDPPVKSNRSKTAFELIKQEGKFNRFQSLISAANFEFALHEDQGPFTVLAPINEAWDALTPTALDYLKSPEGHYKLLQILDNHLVYGKMVDILSLHEDSSTLFTVQLYPIRASVSVEGAIKLTSSDMEGNITQADIWTSNGVIHSISAVFVPPTAEPIVPQICNQTAYEAEWSQCLLCDQDKEKFCPAGSVPTDESQSCIFGASLVGCQYKCNITILIPDCCYGFYGSTCLACPAGYLTPCNNHGQCMDGISGNGSCLCLPEFSGTECELCTDPTKFGPNCDQACSCLHGVCDNFPNGTGQCLPGSCLQGYTGVDCDKQTTPCGSEDDLLCHAHAQCLVVEEVAQCLCDPNYEGSGQDCIPIDPCQKDYYGHCHEFAACLLTGPGTNLCECLEGFEGDGYSCVAIDNCQLPDLGGCGPNAVCMFTGPAENECECDFGYSGDGYRCTEVDSCQSNNGGCHQFAKCISTGPGVNDCECKAGYIGDGYICHGTIAEEISNNPELKDWYSIIETGSMSQLLSSPSENLTIFAPTSLAFTELVDSKQLDLKDPSVTRDLVLFHLTQGVLPYTELKEHLNSWLPTLLNGTHLTISSNNGEDIQVNGATIVERDLPATNGLIHLIDFYLIPPLDMMTITYPTLEELFLKNDQYLLFYFHLKSSGLLESLKTASGYTILTTSNSTIEDSPTASPDKNQLMFHIVYGKRYTFQDLYKSALVLDSWMGHNHQLTFVGESGQVKVNHEAVITDSDLLTDVGVVHGLSAFLQIVPNRCDTNTTKITRGLCGDCSTPFTEFCPSSAQPTGNPTECFYQALIGSQSEMLLGCQVDCLQINYTAACCPGFFGSDCQACPGGLEPCSRRGICDDDIDGDGSCSCLSNFVGDACQSCQPDFYGINCDQECNCVNGVCNEVDGICTCHPLWTGTDCNTIQSEGDLECGENTCSQNGYCLAQEELCVCHVGFEGNGINCTAVDPCTDSNGGCSPFATCSLLDLLTVAECTCNPGFAGDGYVCLEINPCDQLENLCHPLADCIHTGPDKYACVCQAGYEGDGVTGCAEVNPCQELNGGCNDKATCSYTGPGLRNCSCLPDYIGDGFTCAGTLREEIGGRIPGVTQFRLKYEEYIEKLMGSFLSYPAFFTVFIPTDEAFLNFATKNPDLELEWSQNNIWAMVIQYHVIGCVVLTSSDLQTTAPLVSLSGLEFPITVKEDSEVELKDGARLVSVDHAATNGIIHTIDTVLIPPKLPAALPPPVEETSPDQDELLESLLEATDSFGLTIFGELLQTSPETILSMFSSLNSPLTIFVPSNLAWESMPDDLLVTLRDPANYDMLQEYLQYHIVANQMLNAADLLMVSALTTLQGSDISLECSGRQGDIHVNGQDALVMERQIPFVQGVAHAIDWVLEPPSLGGRCDIVNTLIETSACVKCNTQPQCEEGYINRGPINHNCEIKLDGWYEWMEGCSQECVKQEVESQCCNNHYGPDCQECPGGARYPCNGRGVCGSGILGNGTCDCVQGFTGTACELCMDGYYGPDCQVCQCTDHGVCVDGKLADGSCFCDPDWTGALCEQQLSAPAVCSPPCYSHSICRPDNLCECLPGYFNSGFDCQLIEQCQLDNGGCHEFALCQQDGTAVSCTCLDNYEGDGVFCQGIDRCQLNNGGCHPDAACTYTGPNLRSCECLEGFIGDGFICTLEPLDPLKCDIEHNGGCSSNAWCNELLPSKTLPVGAIDCECMEGYVGDGIICNGDTFQTIEMTSSFSYFFKSLVENTDSSVQNLLKNMTAQITLFAPLDPDKSFNQSNLLTESTVENHIVTSLVMVNSSDSTDNSVKVKSMSGKKLVITLQNSTLFVSGVPVVKADIPTANGLLHVIQQPIVADGDESEEESPSDKDKSSISTASVMAVVVIVLVIFIVILAGVYFSRRYCQNSWTLPSLQFTRGSGSIDDRVTIGIGDNSAQLTSFDNPLYGSSLTAETPT